MTYEVVSNYKYADRKSAQRLVAKIKQNMGNCFSVRPAEETWRDYFWRTNEAQDGC